MADTHIEHQANVALMRIWPRIIPELASCSTADQAAFEQRLRREWPRLFTILLNLYGQHYDCHYHMEQLLLETARSWVARPATLKQLDLTREAHPDWFSDQQALGGVLYVDRFAKTLAGVREQIPYFKELGLTYLHLMPLFAAPEGNSDGGYAVSSYRDVNPALGTITELAELTEALRNEGISPVVDFIFNHTSDEHLWARNAQAGDPTFQQYYYIFPDRQIPDAYERTLREIFPTVRRGSFTWREDMHQWVWTTFNSFQWDLNYSNPEVFRAMAGEMLFLANIGIEVLRLDAVAFIWKRMGTSCENLPEAHLIIQAFNALTRIAAPALIFKSEAIVHPDDVVKYISPEECQISYNPTFMALLWEALATTEVKLLARSMNHRYRLPKGCAWVNYLRCHDDIGWTFDDGDAQFVGIDPYGHRRFLNDFYIGRFQGSFARGLPFQENPDTGDARISGTLASLAGLEQALLSGDDRMITLALRRIVMLHGLILSAGGVPLIYLGDELAQLNDYSYTADPNQAGDSRWVHRPYTDWQRADRRHNPLTPEGQIFGALRRLIALRKELPTLRGGDLEVVDSGNAHIFAFVRQGGGRLLVLANFSSRPQNFDANRLRLYGPGYRFRELIGDREVTAERALSLDPYQIAWLIPE
ncbi:MAG: alpha-amylase family glycosyl hydrolase [Roseiflexaceae bacterium]